MITTPEEYFSKLYQIQSNNLPTAALLLPSDERIYNIDLNTRIIEAPEFLSVETDHFAETIYFKVDRYFDNMDLTKTVCVIQYENDAAKNAEGRPAGSFAYLVPFYDIAHFGNENKILIPWAIGGAATAAAGTVTFAMRFYKFNADKSELIYNLNTMPAKSKVLHGMNVITDENENFIVADNVVAELYAAIDNISERALLTWEEE